MSELHSSIYFKANSSEIQNRLIELFRLGYDDRNSGEEFSAQFIQISTGINPELGEKCARQFITDLDKKYLEAWCFEDIDELSGYSVATWVAGGSGDKALGATLRFLYRLCPEIHAQAWGMGDDDPWEFWFKFENNQLIRQDDEPFDDCDGYIRDTIYRWWHEDMPSSIKEGMLNDEEDEDDEDASEDYSPISEEQYQKWLVDIRSGTQLEQDAEEIVADELVNSLIGALGGLFGGSRTRSHSTTDAIDAEYIDERIVNAVFAATKLAEENFDIDGVLTHLSSEFKMSVTMLNAPGPMEIGVAMYRMGLKMILRESTEYSNSYEILNLAIDDGGSQARVNVLTKSTLIEPDTGERVYCEAITDYTLEVVEGKALFTHAVSEETVKKAIA